MDFKNRFPARPTEGGRNPSFGNSNKPPTNNPFANAFSSGIRQPSNPINIKPRPTKEATGLDKFKKAPSKGTAPKGQFKKYMVEANNVFYDDRPELKELEKIKLCKWFLILVWILLAGSYFLIRRIAPYQGVCPPKAKCGVFVRCPELYEYHRGSNECRLSGDFLEEIEAAAINHVQQVQLEYGQRECLAQEGIPSFNINDLFEQLDENKISLYREAASNFFYSKENQEIYGFKVVGNSGVVLPTQRHYSLRCSLLLIITDTFQLMVFLGCILGAALIGWIAYRIVRSQRYSKMYDFLKERVMEAENKTLNVTHALTDLQGRFGPIDEEGWGKINDLRASDKKIGFYEDDFLYWKAS